MNTNYGIKIKNYEAGSLYQCNIGVRQNYDYTKAMFANNLLMYYLLDNGLKVENGWTRDIICIEFNYGSRSYDEEIAHINKMIEKNQGCDEDKMNFLLSLKTQAENNEKLFDKKSADDIRKIFYANGVEIRHDVRNKKDKVVKEEFIHYKMLYRSTGKAKQGSCMFICDRLYDKAYNFITMGLELPYDNAPIVEMCAYTSLIASAITGTIKINPKNILVLKDIESEFTTNVVSVETDNDKHCILVPKDNYTVKNNIFDGQGLIDESVFPEWGEGYILLRHHMCKVACFKTKIQKFFQDRFGDNYLNATVEDMWGNKHYAKDIEIITTESAMKWLKFSQCGITYDYWCDKVFENGCRFGIVKTAHKSKLGDVQKMSYQMINSLDVDIMPSVVEESVRYINLLKQDTDTFLQYLKDNSNFSNDYEVLYALCEQNRDFAKCDYFRSRKSKIIEGYIKNFKFGKVIQNADNLVFVGSPYAMLLYSIGDSIERDTTFTQENGVIQCYTERFNDGEYLACFRSPHNSKNNIAYLHNVYSEEYKKYFDFGQQIIALNNIHTDIQDRMNGCDYDSDCGFTTNQYDIVNCAKYCYANYPTIVNNVPKDKNKYSNNLDNYAIIDNKLAHAQAAIGTSSNIAQIAQTYMYNFDDEKYKEYVCILSVLAQVAIDNAKRTFDIDLNNEIDRIKKDMNIDFNGYPLFWKLVKDKKIKISDKKFKMSKINKELKCPMNYLANLKFENANTKKDTIPIGYFFNKFELESDRRKCKRIEEFIQNYSLDIYNCDDLNSSSMLLLRSDFDDLIDNIKHIYISKNYLGLMSWLIDRAFLITCGTLRNKHSLQNNTDKNKSLLLKVLYDINSKNLLKVFSNKNNLYT